MTGGCWSLADFCFAPDHPTAAGHFPDNPIIPGALLLDHVLRAVAPNGTGEVRAAKFHHPARPGDRIEIRWRILDSGDTAFDCRVACGGATLLSGSLAG